MRPLIETVKSDKIVDENFENVKNVLCGNVSLDNMPVRILEGTTGAVDTQNQVIHSGNSRPVGWLPLVGDVYVQEISDKFIDIRSTKPECNYKILVLFGPPISDNALKAIGGPNYADTTETATNITNQLIAAIEEVVITYEPLAIRSSILPNPCDLAGPPNNQYQKVLTDGNYFYILLAGTAVDCAKKVWRINRTTGAVDNLDLSATVGGSSLTVMVGYGTDLYIPVKASGDDLIHVFKVDIATFTVTKTWDCPGYAGNYVPRQIVVNNTHIYFNMPTPNSTSIRVIQIDKTTDVVTELVICGPTGDVAKTYSCHAMVNVGDTALFCVVDNNFKVCVEVIRIDLATFTVSDTLTSTYAFGGRAGIYYNGFLYFPVIYDPTHRGIGGTVQYISGVVKMDAATPYSTTIIPVNVEYFDMGYIFTSTIVESGGFLYMVTYNPNAPMGTVVIRLDPATDEVVHSLIPLAITGTGSNGLNSYTCVEPDGSLLFIRNTSSVDFGNFEFATVDYSSYDA